MSMLFGKMCPTLCQAKIVMTTNTGTTRSVGRFGADMHAVLGVTEHHKGRVAVYGDSNCLDSSHMRTPCFRLLSKLLTYVATVSNQHSLTETRCLRSEPEALACNSAFQWWL